MKYKIANDKELWERCQLYSDELAYNEIFRRYFPRMLRIATRYVKDSMKAEELVMDGFFNLWDKRRQIIEGNFLNYLFRCVRNSVISHFRKEIPIILELEQVNTYQAEQTTDRGILFEDVLHIYHTVLKKLSLRRRQVFQMSREENLTYAEIAQKMNLSIGTVENYMVAALDSLRENMKGYISILLFFIFSIF